MRFIDQIISYTMVEVINVNEDLAVLIDFVLR